MPDVDYDTDVTHEQEGPKRWLNGFATYIRQHGELKPLTVKVYLCLLKHFMRFLEGRRVREIRRMRLTDIDAFFAEKGKRMSPRSLYMVRASLRSFLKYLYVEGALVMDLSCCLPRPPCFSADRRPKYLPWAKVEELLSSIDRSSLKGKRNYAIVTLLACHGLRAGEAAKLRMQDINFNEGSFLLRDRKDGRCARLPLSPRAKEALEDYLKLRPTEPCVEFFLSVLPPLRSLSAACVGDIAQFHLRRRFPSGLPFYGSHVLRHSFAKCLLDRGARLTDIGMILGHRNLRSTLVYARIATGELKEVADNYARLL